MLRTAWWVVYVAFFASVVLPWEGQGADDGEGDGCGHPSYDATFWLNDDEAYLDVTLVKRIACTRHFPARFALYLHETLVDAVGAVDCVNASWAAGVPPGGHVKADVYRIPQRVIDEYNWDTLGSDVARAAALHEELPYDHVDVVLNALISSKLFYLSWGRRRDDDLVPDLRRDWALLTAMSDVAPVHERPRLYRHLMPMDELLPHGDGTDGPALRLVTDELAVWTAPTPVLPVDLSAVCIPADPGGSTGALQSW